jgi:hypothetical protein
MPDVHLIAKKGSTFHDFPYSSPKRKCFHCWIVNVTPPGPNHCIHSCLYCYARDNIYSDYSEETLIYNNLPELVVKDLNKLSICPPISISNITDPCQDIPELRLEVKRLIQTLMEQGVSFAITTKGDPSFLMDIPGFVEYEPKLVAVTIEGTAEILQLISPKAPHYYSRIVTVKKLSQLGIRTVVRMDPIFLHLFQALYKDDWFGQISRMIKTFGASGVKHIIGGTGRLSKQRSRSNPGDTTSSWERISKIIDSYSRLEANKFLEEYLFERDWAGRGYTLRNDLRLDFHRKLKTLVEAEGMTYAVCQELPAKECDSSGIPHCEGMPLPFTKRGLGGKFYPIPGCTANCYVNCRELGSPPCGKPELVTFKPLRRSNLK